MCAFHSICETKVTGSTGHLILSSTLPRYVCLFVLMGGGATRRGGGGGAVDELYSGAGRTQRRCGATKVTQGGAEGRRRCKRCRGDI